MWHVGLIPLSECFLGRLQSLRRSIIAALQLAHVNYPASCRFVFCYVMCLWKHVIDFLQKVTPHSKQNVFSTTKKRHIREPAFHHAITITSLLIIDAVMVCLSVKPICIWLSSYKQQIKWWFSIKSITQSVSLCMWIYTSFIWSNKLSSEYLGGVNVLSTNTTESNRPTAHVLDRERNTISHLKNIYIITKTTWQSLYIYFAFMFV